MGLFICQMWRTRKILLDIAALDDEKQLWLRTVKHVNLYESNPEMIRKFSGQKSPDDLGPHIISMWPIDWNQPFAGHEVVLLRQRLQRVLVDCRFASRYNKNGLGPVSWQPQSIYSISSTKIIALKLSIGKAWESMRKGVSSLNGVGKGN